MPEPELHSPAVAAGKESGHTGKCQCSQAGQVNRSYRCLPLTVR